MYASTLDSAGAIAAIVAASLAVIASAYGLIRAYWTRIHDPFDIDFTDRDLRDDTASKECVLRGGGAHDVYVRLRVKVSRELEVGEVMVRPVENLRHRWRHKITNRGLKWDPPLNGEVVFTELADAEAEYYAFHFENKPFQDFVTRQHADERATQIGIFVPAYRRAKGQSLSFRIQVEVNEPWNGWLLLKIPNGKGEMIWRYLPLWVEP